MVRPDGPHLQQKPSQMDYYWDSQGLFIMQEVLNVGMWDGNSVMVTQLM